MSPKTLGMPHLWYIHITLPRSPSPGPARSVTSQVYVTVWPGDTLSPAATAAAAAAGSNHYNEHAPWTLDEGGLMHYTMYQLLSSTCTQNL
jgi:hypothetical protein